MTLAEAKVGLTIHDLWRHFGLEGQPSKSCRCPFHEDKNASFSITSDGKLFNCFAGCGGGDQVDFLALATRLPKPEACREFIRLAGGSPSFTGTRLLLPKPLGANGDGDKAEQRKTWPPLESLICGLDGMTDDAAAQLERLRHVSLEGVRLMASRGLLWFAVWKGKPAWIVTDGARVNAQARRMDGKLWEAINAKAQTLPGSTAAWPIGLQETELFWVILLVEGGPDLLAAHHFIDAHGREQDTAAIAMLGASNRIPNAALPLFVGKRVRIMAHADEAGRAAAKRWAEQLEGVADAVDAVNFTGLLMADGCPVKDLNDCTRLDLKQTQKLSDLIPQ